MSATDPCTRGRWACTPSPSGTYACPILGCGKSKPHGHSLWTQERLQEDRAFLAADVPIPERALRAAKLYRRALSNVQGVGPRGCGDAGVDAKWGALDQARHNFEIELFYLPNGLHDV